MVIFLATLAEGQRAIVMALCPSCVHLAVRLSVHLHVHASVNSSFKKLLLRNFVWIFTKFHRNVP